MKSTAVNSQRISGLDAFRGLCLIGVFISHFYFDLTLFYRVPTLPYVFRLLFEYGGILFVVLSGVCSHLGTKAVKRGIVVFICGMIITAVSCIVAKVLKDDSVVIRFGILHLLGICMILSPLLKKMQSAAILPLSILFVFFGYILRGTATEIPWLFPFGFKTVSFSSGDYWPLFPHLGFFMLGIYLGKRFYPEKKPIFPALQDKFPVLRYIGRHSLLLYLLQQPLAVALIVLFDLLFLHTISF